MTTIKMMIIFSLVLGVLLFLIPNLLWLLGWIAGKIFHFLLPYAPFGYTSLGLVLLCWLVMAYGYFVGRWNVKTTHITFENRDLPASFNGFTIVHISDLHLNTFEGHPEQLQRFVQVINDQHPDLICFTGDLVSMSANEIQPHTQILKQLQATHGVASVLGNHDFLIYSRNFATPEARDHAVAQLAHYEQDTLGWHLLRNKNWEIRNAAGDKITIVGVDNTNYAKEGFRTINNGDLPAALQGSDGFRILLSHDPTHWTDEVVPTTNIPLTLSGHTHAAQVRLFGWTPAKLSFKETDGRYDRDGQTLYINIGLGCTVPFRIGANPEVTVIKLQSTKSTKK